MASHPEIDCTAPADPLLPTPDILDRIRAGELLTTQQVIGRMGLLATVPLQRRIHLALHDLGFVQLDYRRPGDSHTVRVWIEPPAPSVSDHWRRVHEDGDRARGILPPRRTGLIARIVETLFPERAA